jgi:DNA (cytosine-5)-methyltransferase 1
MARLGLGEAWHCLRANDCDQKKAAAYRRNFNEAPELMERDVRRIEVGDLPGKATLAWASFPCQDLSLAGQGAGMKGERSGVFWPFWSLMLSLKDERRIPPLIVLENVAGLITSHKGQDLLGLLNALVDAGYRVGAMVVDAAHFVPQSRPRLFIVCVLRGVAIPRNLIGRTPSPTWHPNSLQDRVEELPPETRRHWIWWRLPAPSVDVQHLSEILEMPEKDAWHPKETTQRLLAMMSESNLKKVRAARLSGVRQVGTIYKRTRKGIQRAEVRFDGISGCLRTPAGGSSRQIIIVVESNSVRTRLITPRETARLMGLPESFKLPPNYNDAYHLTGDGVVVPAVSWLERHLLRPIGASALRLVGRATRSDRVPQHPPQVRLKQVA